MAKRIAIILRYSPLNSIRGPEGFRLGVGMTLEGNNVDLILMGQGAWSALPLQSSKVGRPDANQFIDSLELCGITAYVDFEEIPVSLQSKLRKEFVKKEKSELFQLISRADVVISF